MPVGDLVKEVQSVNGRRGPKSKWGPILQIALDNPGQWVCAAESEDEDELRKSYNNVRSAAHRHESDFQVVMTTDNTVCVKVK